MSEMTETSPVDETDPIYVQRRMLRFRSWHRGTKEADLLLGSFCDRYVNTFTPEQLCRYEALLEAADHDIFNWKLGRAPVPPERDDDVMALLKTHNFVDVIDS